MEKNLNKEQLKDFKKKEARPNAMIPGIFSESPLRQLVQAAPGSKQPIQSLQTTPRRDGDKIENLDYKTANSVQCFSGGKFK